ncbi:hypothetical protein GUITHDRAFT_153423 [Guillardia theta CCMP2712]|uniref:Uncharacterized protein n=1 Tax=Guillardia theta (strain CCMP2712) TaxID=905079 RepID=L1J4J6_GUITC|nr:hypothetical protein GUITHDRAFT_153423 [Guillardia theta CCMP2712]EKX43010.1 hypothetical protein GUITHDRAFT_153423 [Guillardia theta CCMP2712]|eukprot:XP_005829990.1 hypothetical protein GUITHDRAFT_153423 [Guillardia theta CCMP2712]
MPCAELFLEWMQAETQSLSEVSFKHCNTVFMCPWIQESKTNASDVDRKRLPKLRRDSEGDERRYGSSEPSSTEAENKIGVALRKTALDDVQIPHAREQRSGLQPVKISNLQEKIPTPARQRRAASVDLSTPPQLYKFQENLQGKLRPSSQIDFHEICKDLECRNSPEPGMAKEEWSHHRDARSRRSHQLHSSQPRRHSEYGLIVEKGRTEVLMGRSSPKSDSKVRRSKIINESYLEDFHNRRESAARAAAQSSDTTYRSKLIFHTKAQSRLREALFQSN